MARARIRIEDFERGTLPGVCVVSGQPTTTTAPFEFNFRVLPSDRSGAFNVLGGGLWELIGSQRATLRGFLPTGDEARIRPARGRARARLVMVLGALLLVVGLPLAVQAADSGRASTWVISVSVGIIALGGVMDRRPPGTLSAAPDPTLRWLEIWPVADEFVAAYERLEARRAADTEDADPAPLPNS